MAGKSGMNIGDLVIRKIDGVDWKSAQIQRKQLGYGFVISKHMAGDPVHPCITVFYPKVGQAWDIAESLMKIVSKKRS